MILTSTLRARAGRGYRWLQNYGPVHGLDVKRLHHPAGWSQWGLDVEDPDVCPLALSDTGPSPVDGNRYTAVLVRLKHSPHFRNMDMHKFLTDHGFDIWPGGNLITRPIGIWILNAGGARDFRVLTQAWRKVIAANATSLDD